MAFRIGTRQRDERSNNLYTYKKKEIHAFFFKTNDIVHVLRKYCSKFSIDIEVYVLSERLILTSNLFCFRNPFQNKSFPVTCESGCKLMNVFWVCYCVVYDWYKGE